MQPYAITITGTSKSNLEEAFNAAESQLGHVGDEVKGAVAQVAAATADLVESIIHAEHVGISITGLHPAEGDGLTPGREGFRIEVYATEAPPAPTPDVSGTAGIEPATGATPGVAPVSAQATAEAQAAADAQRAANEAAAQAGGANPAAGEVVVNEVTPQGETPASPPAAAPAETQNPDSSSGAQPGEGGPGDTSSGASPIGPGQSPAGEVPDAGTGVIEQEVDQTEPPPGV